MLTQIRVIWVHPFGEHRDYSIWLEECCQAIMKSHSWLVISIFQFDIFSPLEEGPRQLQMATRELGDAVTALRHDKLSPLHQQPAYSPGQQKQQGHGGALARWPIIFIGHSFGGWVVKNLLVAKEFCPAGFITIDAEDADSAKTQYFDWPVGGISTTETNSRTDKLGECLKDIDANFDRCPAGRIPVDHVSSQPVDWVLDPDNVSNVRLLGRSLSGRPKGPIRKCDNN